MNLTTTPDITNFPETHYVYVEKVGPFQETAQKAWQQLHENTAKISEYTKITGFMSLYKVDPEMIYLAGAKVSSKPEKLPPGFSYMKFDGGKYTRFTLTGSYSNLPEACGVAFETIEKNKTQLRDSYFIENYVNDPKVTPEDQLITEIMMPTK